MSLHESVVTDLQRIVAESGADIITASSLALSVLHRYAPAGLDSRVEYLSLEGLKHLARNVLSGRYNADSDEAEAYHGQGEMFSGHLQARYPLARKKGEDQGYKLRHLLTPEERAWNVSYLRKAGSARLAHADALEAEAITQIAAAQ